MGDVEIRFLLVWMMLSAPIFGVFLFCALYFHSKTWLRRAQPLQLRLDWKRISKQSLIELEKKLGIHLFQSLEMQLTILGGGKKPVIDPISLILFSGSLSVSSMLVTFSFSRTWIVVFIVGAVLFCLPFMVIHTRYLRITSRTRHVFMAFVEGFLQTYVDENKVVLLAFKNMGSRCPEEMRSILEYVKLRLSDGTPFEESVWVLAEILQFGWAYDFVYIVISAKNGDSKSGEKALANFLMQLQTARNVDLDRKAITKIVFLYMVCLSACIPFFMLLNMGFLKEAKQIYFATQAGINFLLLGSLVIILSFVMALIWSRRGERL